MGKIRAFSLAETLVALGLIGVLCVTMLSLNSMSENKYKVATTKLAKADSAIKTWGKAISKNNETGLGATKTVYDDESLINSLKKHFALQDDNIVTTEESITTPDGATYSNLQKMTLNDGTTISAKYIAATKGSKSATGVYVYQLNEMNSTLAVISVDVPVTKNSSETVSEEYALKATGIESLTSMYEGWDKYEKTGVEITTTDANGDPTTLYQYCIAGTTTCMNSTSQSSFIYVKNNSQIACQGGQTGFVTSRTIGLATGTYEVTESTCCPEPRVKNSQEEECRCPSQESMSIMAGYHYDSTATLCQSLVTAGAYSGGGNLILCGHTLGDTDADVKKGYYCPNDGMSGHIICPKGYYCPNYGEYPATDKNDKYNGGIFYTENGIQKIHAGGLIKPVKCPAGSYCNEEGLMAKKTCPAGSYCPEGSVNPIKCPAGTFNPDSGASLASACHQCEAGSFSNVEGAASCKTCDRSKGEYSNTAGAKGCSVCKAGTFLNSNNVCVSCPEGTFRSTAGGVDSCQTCEGNTYQNKTGQTSCITCPEHSTRTGTGAPTSVAVCKCDAGYGTDESGTLLNGSNACKAAPKGRYSLPDDNRIIQCTKGNYQNEVAQSACKPCPADYFQNFDGQSYCYHCPSTSNTDGAEGSDSIVACKCPAGQYGTNLTGSEGGVLQLNSSVCTNCPADTYKGGRGNKLNLCLACPDNSDTNGATGKTLISECTCKAGWVTWEKAADKYSGANFTNNDAKTNATPTLICHKTHCAHYSPAGTNIETYCAAPSQSSDKNSQSGDDVLKDAIYAPSGSSSVNQCAYRKANNNERFTDNNPTNHCAVTKCPDTAIVDSNATYNSANTNGNSNERKYTGCLCNPGYYGDGLTCTKCPKGTFKADYGNGTADQVCQKCDVGEYQDEQGQTECKKCALGTASNETGRQSACPDCSKGTFAADSNGNAATKGAATQCKKCAAGSYQEYTKQVECTPCAIGTASNVEGRTSACDPCPKGKHGNNTKGLTACVNCPAGTYSATTGLKDASECTWCAPGKYSTAEGATAATTCQNCPKDTYTVASYTSRPDSSAVCQHCPNGTYSLATGAVDTVGKGAGVCQYCAIGKRFNDSYTGANKGKYTTVAQICSACPSNTYGNKVAADATNDLKNADDKYNLNNYPSCSPCPFGTHFSGTGATKVSQCVPCPAGQGTNADGSCSSCKAGEYSVVSSTNSNVNECKKCPAGTYSVAGSSGINSCKKCPQDTYADKEGSASCKPCTNNTYANGTGNTSCTACKDYGDSVYLITQGHNHAVYLGTLLQTFTCVPSSQITYTQKWSLYNGEGRQNLYIISSDGWLIDYIDTHNSVVNPVKDNGGSYGKGKMDSSIDEYYYSTQGRQGWTNNNTCNAHGSSVVGGTLQTMRKQCS